MGREIWFPLVFLSINSYWLAQMSDLNHLDRFINYIERLQIKYNSSLLYELYWFLVDTQEYFHDLWWNKLRVPDKLSFLGEHNPYYSILMDLEDQLDRRDGYYD